MRSAPKSRRSLQLHAPHSRTQLRSLTASRKTRTKIRLSLCSCCVPTSRSGCPTRRMASRECQRSRPLTLIRQLHACLIRVPSLGGSTACVCHSCVGCGGAVVVYGGVGGLRPSTVIRTPVCVGAGGSYRSASLAPLWKNNRSRGRWRFKPSYVARP